MWIFQTPFSRNHQKHGTWNTFSRRQILATFTWPNLHRITSGEKPMKAVVKNPSSMESCSEQCWAMALQRDWKGRGPTSLGKGDFLKKCPGNPWKHLVHFSVWLPISTFICRFHVNLLISFVFREKLRSIGKYMSYNPNIKTLLQLEKPWWKPAQPQFLVPRHML